MDWLIVFSVVLAALAMFKSAVKRTVADKVVRVGDLLIWQGWNPAPSISDGSTGWTGWNKIASPDRVPIDTDNFKADVNTKMKTGSTQIMGQTTKEAGDTMSFITNQTRRQRSISVSVPKDQQYLYDRQADVPVDINTINK